MLHSLRHTAGRAARAGRLLLALLAIGTVAGCATVQRSTSADTDAASADRSRAERVFLYQSRVADALLDRYPLMEIFQDADPTLVQAEAQMTKNCSPLTQAVLSKLEGNEPSFGLRLQVFTTLGACERAAQRIEQLLLQRENATASAI